MNVPWTLFVSTGAIESGPYWWQETLLSALRSGSANYEVLKSAALGVSQQDVRELPDDPALSILVLYGSLPSIERDDLIAAYCCKSATSQRPRDMATWENLRTLYEGGVAIGAHGASHLPLTMVENPRHEIFHSRSALEINLGAGASSTMSFPHGRYDTSVVEIARKEGVQLLFTSDPVLNKCPGGWLESDLIGRISIATADVAGPLGVLRPERVVPWLMLRRRTVM
jgi:peptidoglycan/xylan/chitin deacetylase (PgdA/CDA1 family)